MSSENKKCFQLGIYISRAFRAMSSNVNRSFAENGFDVTGEQWRVLFELWLDDGQTQAELCERLLQDKTGVSRLIDGLEKRKLVRREKDMRDRRCKRIWLTDEGREREKDLLKLAHEAMQGAQAGIPQEDIETCKAVLSRIFLNLRDEELLPEWLEVKIREKKCTRE